MTLEQIFALFEKLPPELARDIKSLLDKFGLWIVALKAIPLPFRKVIGNNFLHQIVKILKKFNKDSTITRGIALAGTRSLFDLPNDWQPKWIAG